MSGSIKFTGMPTPDTALAVYSSHVAFGSAVIYFSGIFTDIISTSGSYMQSNASARFVFEPGYAANTFALISGSSVDLSSSAFEGDDLDTLEVALHRMGSLYSWGFPGKITHGSGAFSNISGVARGYGYVRGKDGVATTNINLGTVTHTDTGVYVIVTSVRTPFPLITPLTNIDVIATCNTSGSGNTTITVNTRDASGNRIDSGFCIALF
jgi:hypothetical protein